MARLLILHVVILLVFVNGNDCDFATQKRIKTIERFRQYVQGLDISALPNNVRDRLKNLTKVPLVVGVTGNSGTDKSSLINTLRNLSAADPKAAPVGVVEKTTERYNYSDPKKLELVYWDLPGCGTPAFPRETYLDRVGFDEYDFLKLFHQTDSKKMMHGLLQNLLSEKKNSSLYVTKLM